MRHLVIDFWGCLRFPSEGQARQLLGEICAELELKPMAPPLVRWVTDGGLNDGMSGIVLIAESHIAFHDFRTHQQAYFDIISCKPFAFAPILARLIECFRPRAWNVKKIERLSLGVKSFQEEIEARAQ